MVIREILQYLTEHPDAKDTIQGILRWWFLPNGMERKKEEVQKSLDDLTAKGWLTRRQTPPYQILYGVNQEKLEEMKAFLIELEGEVERPGD